MRASLPIQPPGAARRLPGMSRREFTRLSPSEAADEIVRLVAEAIAGDRRFPTLSPLELELLLADARDHIEIGLDELVTGIVEIVENDK